jgi:TetR/AcrR family transcriptional regulator, copper-responsive repressor
MKTTSPPATRGRPRQFDRDAALDAAMRLFWDRGYAGTSMSDLLAAMNINAPSLYAAFGDKKALFESSVEHYQVLHGAFAVRALAGGGTARQSIEKLMRDAAKTYTDPALPHGCMVVCSGINCSEDDNAIKQSLQERRKQSALMIKKRIERGVADGDVPTNCDVGALANYIATVFQGLSIQARDGASRKALDAVVTQSLKAWPA